MKDNPTVDEEDAYQEGLEDGREEGLTSGRYDGEIAGIRKGRDAAIGDYEDRIVELEDMTGDYEAEIKELGEMNDNLLCTDGPLFAILWRAYLVNPIDTENDLISLRVPGVLAQLQALRQTTYKQNLKQTEKARRAEKLFEERRVDRCRAHQPSLCG